MAFYHVIEGTRASSVYFHPSRHSALETPPFLSSTPVYFSFLLCARYLWKGQINQHQLFHELRIFECVWAAQVQGQIKEWIFHGSTEQGAVNSEGGLGRHCRGNSFKVSLGKRWCSSAQGLGRTGTSGCSVLANIGVRLCQNYCSTTWWAWAQPPTDWGKVYHSICSFCRKFTGNAINCTMFQEEYFSVKTFFLLGRSILQFACAFTHSRLHY